MKKVLIVGAGGMGREVFEWINLGNAFLKGLGYEPAWEFLGFIDDDLHALDNSKCDAKVVGTISDYKRTDGEFLIMGVSKPHVKEKLAALLKEKGGVFTTFNYPENIISPSATVGEGCVFYPGAFVGVDCKVGDFVTLLSTSLGHDAELGDYSTVSSWCGINGHVKVGKKAFVGSNAVILPGKKIGDEATVGIGSVVISNVKAGGTVFGNPAKKI